MEDDDTTEEARLKAKNDHFNVCKEAFRSMKSYSGVAVVKDTRRMPESFEEKVNPQDEMLDEVMRDAEVVEDQVMEDAQEAEVASNAPILHQGSYVMGPTSLSCLIYKVHSIDPEAFNSFALLECVRHPAIVRHHTFYEEAREPRVVLSWVDCELWDLITADKASTRFFIKSKRNGISFKPELKTMILDICRGLNHFFELDLYPLKIGLFDLYACKDGPKNHRVQMLILKVEKLASQKAKRTRMTALWEQVREIIDDIRKNTDTDELNEVTKRFIKYIRRNVDVTLLAQYPLSWSYDQKGCYLISIISADKRVVCKCLEGSGLEWPKGDNGLGVPKILTVLIEHDRTRDYPSKYSTDEPYDYLNLSRTVFKHFPDLSKEVPELKNLFKTREDFLERMEKWEPQIWCILYDAIGIIASP